MHYLLLVLGSLWQYEAVSGYAIKASNDSTFPELPNIEKRQSIVTIQPISTVIITQTPLATRSSSRASTTLTSSSSTLSSSTSRTISTSSPQNSNFNQAGSFTGTVFTSIKSSSIDRPRSTVVNTLPQSTRSPDKVFTDPKLSLEQLIGGSIGGVAALVVIIVICLIAPKRIAQIVRNGNFKLKMSKFFKPNKSKTGRSRSTGWWSRIPLPKLGTTELSGGKQYTTTELPSNVPPVYELPSSSMHGGLENIGIPDSETYQRVEVPSPGFVAGELKLLNGNVTPRNLTDVETASIADNLGPDQHTEKVAEQQQLESPGKQTPLMLSSQTQEVEPDHGSIKNEFTVTTEDPIPNPSKPKRRETLPPPPIPPRPMKRKKVPDADFRLTSPRGSTILLTLDLPTSPIDLSTPLTPSPIEPPEEDAKPKGPPPIVPPRPVRFRKKEVISEEENIEEEIVAFPVPPSPVKDDMKAESPPEVPPKEEPIKSGKPPEVESTNEAQDSTEGDVQPNLPPRPPPKDASSPTREPPNVPSKPEPEGEEPPIFSSNFSFSSPVFADPDISTQHVSMPPPSREAPISPSTTTPPHPISTADTDIWSLNILLASTDPPNSQPPPTRQPKIKTPSPPSSLSRRTKPILSDQELTSETSPLTVPHTSPPLSPSQLNNFVPLVPYTPPNRRQSLNHNLPPLPPPSVSSTFPNSPQPQSSWRNTTQPQPLISRIPENENSVPDERGRASGSLSPRRLARLAGAFAPVSYSDEKAEEAGVGKWVYR